MANEAVQLVKHTTDRLVPSMRNRRRVDAVPVFGNFSLRLVEREAACADFRVQIIFNFVLGVRSPVGNGSVKRLRPEIFRIRGASAQLQGNEVIFFEISQRGVGVAIFANLLDLQTIRVAGRRADGFRAPPRVADRFAEVGLRDVRIRCAGRSQRIRIDIRRPYARPAVFSQPGGFVRRSLRAKNPKRNDYNKDEGKESEIGILPIWHHL